MWSNICIQIRSSPCQNKDLVVQTVVFLQFENQRRARPIQRCCQALITKTISANIVYHCFTVII